MEITDKKILTVTVCVLLLLVAREGLLDLRGDDSRRRLYVHRHFAAQMIVFLKTVRNCISDCNLAAATCL